MSQKKRDMRVMDRLRERLAFRGSSGIMRSLDTNNVEKFFFRKNIFRNFFSPVFGVIGLRLQDDLEQTSPSPPACKKMVLNPVGWSQGAQDAEK